MSNKKNFFVAFSHLYLTFIMANIYHKLRTFAETFLIAIHFNNHNKYEIDLNCSDFRETNNNDLCKGFLRTQGMLSLDIIFSFFEAFQKVHQYLANLMHFITKYCRLRQVNLHIVTSTLGNRPGQVHGRILDKVRLEIRLHECFLFQIVSILGRMSGSQNLHLQFVLNIL